MSSVLERRVTALERAGHTWPWHERVEAASQRGIDIGARTY